MLSHRKVPEAERSAKAVLGSEQGAALVLAMLAVVVMTMLGLVLMDVLRNSFVQVAATEASVQAESIAQKGLDETLAIIRQSVDKINVAYAADPDIRAKWTAANAAFDRLKDDWRDVVNADVDALRGEYRISVTWEDIMTDPSAPLTLPDAPYVQKAVITSTGTIPGQGPHRTVTKTMTVYVSTINPVFRYPVSASRNLTLNGFSYVVGNVFAGSVVNYSDEALFKGLPGSEYGMKTYLPAIKGFIDAGGDYKNRLVTQAPKAWDPAYFSTVFPYEDGEMTPGESIAVYDDYIKPMIAKLAPLAANGYDSLTSDGIQGVLLTSDLTRSSKSVGNWTTVTKSLKVTGDLAVLDGALTMKAPDGSAEPTLTLSNGSLYVRFPNDSLVAADLSGSLNLDPGKFVVVDGDVLLNDGFSMKGNMYVNGNLKIVGDVNIEGTIYVAGETLGSGTVELKAIRSINDAPDKPPVIIVASGDFQFSDNSLPDNANPDRSLDMDKRIRAFLYTESDLNLYGVHSKFKLYGGIHGNNVELNAVGEKGTKVKSAITTHLPPTPAGVEPATIDLFTSQSGLTEDDSNLKIIYDDYSLYESPPTGIPTTMSLNVFVKDVVTRSE